MQVKLSGSGFFPKQNGSFFIAEMNAKQVAYDQNVEDQFPFSRMVNKQTGTTPLQFVKV